MQSWTAHRAPALARRGVLTSISGPFGTPAAPFSARYMQRYTAHQFWVSVESAVLTAVKREVRVSPLLTAALIRNGCAYPQRLRLSATAALIRNGCAHPQRLRLSATAVLIRNGCAYPQRLRLPAAHASHGQEYLLRPPARMRARALLRNRSILSCGSPLTAWPLRSMYRNSVSERPILVCAERCASGGYCERKAVGAGGGPDPMALGHRCRRCRRR